MEHLDFPTAHKTSNMMDRLMRAMNRHAINSQMFHSTISSTSKNFRAFVLLYKFIPSCPATWDESKKLTNMPISSKSQINSSFRTLGIPRDAMFVSLLAIFAHDDQTPLF